MRREAMCLQMIRQWSNLIEKEKQQLKKIEKKRNEQLNHRIAIDNVNRDRNNLIDSFVIDNLQ